MRLDQLTRLVQVGGGLQGQRLDALQLAAFSAGFLPILVILFALGIRMIGTWLSLIGTDLDSKEKTFTLIAYLPKATVQAAIGGVPLAMGLPAGELILTMSVLAILITAPLGAFGIDFSYRKLLTDDS